MIGIIILILFRNVLASDNCTQFSFCNECIKNIGISGNTCMWLYEENNYLCADYSNILTNICTKKNSPYYSYCPINDLIQNNPCSKINNPLPSNLIWNMVIFIFLITTVLNACAYNFYQYRYKENHPVLGLFLGIIAPYFCWYINP